MMTGRALLVGMGGAAVVRWGRGGIQGWPVIAWRIAGIMLWLCLAAVER